ncbi:ribonuclease domain-containing protein [Streptomyces sp. NPDC046887]|uniref:ribonuclease domain-containing protein n=1 Tax=Streptomyces sp. NPDC046887 TaxID=3155472 RepID=UPI0033C48339
MTIPPRFSLLGGAAALLSALVAGPAAAAPAPVAPFSYGSVTAVQAAAVGEICHSRLPSQAHDTLDLIEAGGPYPYQQDGTVFQNREGILPSRSTGYYHEYTVKTPGADNRGARRIVTGSADEDYYTADHYASFDKVDHGC